jgi:hypothetical protein
VRAVPKVTPVVKEPVAVFEDSEREVRIPLFLLCLFPSPSHLQRLLFANSTCVDFSNGCVESGGKSQ